MKVHDLLPVAVSYGLTLCLTAVLVRRKIHRIFPLFFTFLIYSLIRTPLGVSVIGNERFYFNVFWITEGGSVLLAVLATYEAFMHEFKAFYLIPWFRFVLPSAALVVALYSYWLASSHPPVRATILISLIVTLEIGFQYVQIAIVLISAALIRIFKLSWSSHTSGILTGFGVSSLGILIASLVRSEFGTRFPFFIRDAPGVAYILALLIWLIFLSKADLATGYTQNLSLEQMQQQLRTYLAIFRRDV